MKAQFTSKCASCGELMREGDEIKPVDEEWMHEVCADSSTQPPLARVMPDWDMNWSD